MASNATQNCSGFNLLSSFGRPANISDTILPMMNYLYEVHFGPDNNSLSPPCGSVAAPTLDDFLLPPTNHLASEWERSMRLLDTLQTYYVPPVIALGIMGNVIVVCLLLLAPLCRESSSHYLAAVSLADTAFLGSLFLLWINVFGVDLYNRKGWCQLMSFVTSLCNFLPLWYVVVFAVDRTYVHHYLGIRLSSRSRDHSRSRPFRAKIIIIGILIVGIVIHVNTSLTVGVLDFPGFEKCMVLPRYIPYLNWFSVVDGVVNIVIPYSIVMVALILIGRTYYLRKQYKRILIGRMEIQDGPNDEQNRRAETDGGRLTWLTVLILAVFLLTRMPCEIFRLMHIARNFSESLIHPNPHEFLAQQISQKLLFLGCALKAPICVVFHPRLFVCCKVKLMRLCRRTDNLVTPGTSVLLNHVVSIEEDSSLKGAMDVTIV